MLTVFTDSMELYGSRIAELREKYGPYDERQAAIDYERFLFGITTCWSSPTGTGSASTT